MLSSTISKTYLLRTISILSPVRSTSEWRNTGDGTEQVWFWYVADRCKSLIYLEGQEAFKGISPRSIFLP